MLKSRFPFLIPLCGIIAGILSGNCFNNNDSPEGFPDDFPWGGIAVAIAFVIFLFLSKKATSPMKAIRLNPYHYIWVGFLFYGVGLLAQWYSRPFIISTNQVDSSMRALGVVEEGHSYTSGDLYVVKVLSLVDSHGNKIPINNLRINLKTDGLIAQPDEILSFPARFSGITDNPKFRSSGFSKRLERDGRLYECRASATEITICGDSPSITGFAMRIRDNIASKIEKSQLDHATAGFIISILLGDRSLLNENTFQTFSDAGAAHILALSGMHVAVILALLVPILFPLRLLSRRHTAVWIGILLIWLYAYATGLAPSTTRACVMATFIALANFLQRKNSSGNALLASACLILIFNPSSLYNAGFQLSFVCVASILVFADKLNPVARHAHPRLYNFIALVFVSLAATASTWVLTSYYFGKIPILFLPVNIIIIPLLPFYIWLSAGYTVSLLLGFDPEWIAFILDKTFTFFSDIASALSLNGESVILFRAAWPTVVLWLGGVALIGYAIHRSSRRYPAILGISLLTISIIGIPLFSSASADSIIFHRERTHFGVTLYNGDSPKVKQFPRYAFSRFLHAGSLFTIIDCDISEIPHEYINHTPDSEKDYLILGSGAFKESLENIPYIGNYKKIILHPSVSRKMEKEFLQKCSELNIDNIYCLRAHGPLEEIL